MPCHLCVFQRLPVTQGLPLQKVGERADQSRSTHECICQVHVLKAGRGKQVEKKKKRLFGKEEQEWGVSESEGV